MVLKIVAIIARFIMLIGLSGQDKVEEIRETLCTSEVAVRTINSCFLRREPLRRVTKLSIGCKLLHNIDSKCDHECYARLNNMKVCLYCT